MRAYITNLRDNGWNKINADVAIEMALKNGQGILEMQKGADRLVIGYCELSQDVEKDRKGFFEAVGKAIDNVLNWREK